MCETWIKKCASGIRKCTFGVVYCKEDIQKIIARVYDWRTAHLTL